MRRSRDRGIPAFNTISSRISSGVPNSTSAGTSGVQLATEQVCNVYYSAEGYSLKLVQKLKVSATISKVDRTPEQSEWTSPVDENVRMSGTPLQRSKLHNRYKPAEIVNFRLLIFTVYHSRQVKQLCTLHMDR